MVTRVRKLKRKQKAIEPDSELQFIADLTNLFHIVNDPSNDDIRKWLGPDVIHSLHLPKYNSNIYIVIPLAKCYGISLDALDECANNVQDGKCNYSLQGFKLFCEMIHSDEDSVRNDEFVALQKLVSDFRREQRRRNLGENEDLDPDAAAVVVNEVTEAAGIEETTLKVEEEKKEEEQKKIQMDHLTLLKYSFGFLDAYTIALRCCLCLEYDYDCDILRSIEDVMELSVDSHHGISDNESVPTTETIRILGEYCLHLIQCMKSLDLCLTRTTSDIRTLKEKMRRAVGSSFSRSLRSDRYNSNKYSKSRRSVNSKSCYLSKHLAEAYRFVLPYIGMESDADPPHTHVYRGVSVIQRRANMSDYARHMFGYGHPAISQTLGKSLDAMNLLERSHFLSVFGSPNFYLCTANNDDDDKDGDTDIIIAGAGRFHVHDWLLLARWPIIVRMIKSGMEESRTRELTLLPDIDKTMLRAIVQCIYHPHFNPQYISTPQIDADLLEEYELMKFAPLLPKPVVSDDENNSNHSDDSY
jgi:hypothetical protein